MALVRCSELHGKSITSNSASVYLTTLIPTHTGQTCTSQTFKVAASAHLEQSTAITCTKSHAIILRSKFNTGQYKEINSQDTVWLHTQRESNKTEKLLQQHPWGCYGLSPIGHF